MITDYGTLKSAISDFLNRDDLTDAIPTFIQLAESDINRRLRLRRMLKRATAPLTEHYVTLPGDFLEARNIQLNSSPVTALQYRSPDVLDQLRASTYSTSGQPVFYSILGDLLEFVPIPSGEYEIELAYYARISALSDANATNFLLTNSPDLYLYGSLIHSAPYLHGDERLPTWVSLYESRVAAQTNSDQSAKVSGATATMLSRPLGY